MPRSRLEIAKAALRLAKEQLVPVEDLAEIAHAYPRTLIRWIIGGKLGVHLDGLHQPGVGWVSSKAALQRFMDEFLLASQAADAAEMKRIHECG